MTNILGIDPGLDGALAIVSGDTVVAVQDMPTNTVTVNGKQRRIVDAYALARWIDAQQIDFAVIEDVSSQPKDGAVQAFKFGMTKGHAVQAVASNMIRMFLAHPSTWKRAMGLEGQDKDASRRVASQMFPAASHYWPLKKHDGRAEAVLLAHYGRKFAQ